MSKMMCPVCGGDEYRYLRCQYQGCTDGRFLVPRPRPRSETPPTIPMPQSRAHAEAMLLMAERWLRDNPESPSDLHGTAPESP